MAKKRPDPKKSRLKRFGKWSDSHRADILEEVGLTEQQFRALTRGQRRNTLDRGLALDRQSKDPAATAAPQSIEQIRAAAGNAGQLRFGTAQAELGRYGNSIDPWFQDYVTRTQQIQGQQQQMAAPVIAQAQTNAQQAGQTVLNADPNSEAAQNDILAAASRKALADAFTSVLSGQQNATNTYYANQAGAVEAARVGEHRTQAQGMQDLLRERGAFESDYVTTARDKEHTKGLERKAFGLKETETLLDAQNDANETNKWGVEKAKWATWSLARRRAWIKKVSAAEDGPSKPGEPKYGIDADKWATMSPAERKAAKDAWEAGDGPASNGKDAYGNTKVQRRTNNNQWSAAKAWLNNVPDDLLSNPALSTKVGKETGAAFDIAKIAVFRRKNGYITAAMAKKLDRLGVKYSPRIVGKKGGDSGTSSGGGGGPEGTGQTTPHE
jgi:hypothetical protein